MQVSEFGLKGHEVKVLLNGDFKNPSIKHEVKRLHLCEHGCLSHTPDTCQVYLRTVEEIDEHHVANAANDRMVSRGGAMTSRNKLCKNIVSSQSISNCDPREYGATGAAYHSGD